MRIFSFFSFIVFLTFFLFSCTNNAKINADARPNPTPYFSLKSWAAQQVQHWKTNKIIPLSSLVINGETEKHNKNVNPDVAFQIIADCDLNRPAWIGAYNRIEKKLPNGNMEHTYTALQPKLRTKSLRLVFDQTATPLQIEIINEEKTYFSTTQQHISFFRDSSYTIQSLQNVLWVGKTDIALTYSF